MVQTRPGSQSSLRDANAQRILQAIQNTDGLTHAEVARRSGLSPASVTNIVRLLAERGQVNVTNASRDGRHCRIVSEINRPGHVLGVDVGRTHVRAVLASCDRQVKAERFKELVPGSPASQTVNLISRFYTQMLKECHVKRSDVLVAGVGVPGPIDSASGRIGAFSLLPEWTPVDLEATFSQALKLPVIVENDANLGALGESAWQAHESISTLAYIRLATGIGCGIVIDGKLFRGAGGTAGEIGHVTINEFGPLCRCGNRGCLETMVSIPTQLDLLTDAIGQPVDVATWVRLAHDGHTASLRLLEDLGRHLGASLASLCNLINPAVVALGGPVTQAGQLLLGPVYEEVRRRALPAACDHVRIEVARHAERSVVFGALVLGLAALSKR